MRTAAGLCGLLLVVAAAGGQDPPRFRDVEIEDAYAPYLRANPLLMDAAGAKVIRLPGGGLLVVGVGAVAITGDGPKARLNAEIVCRQKALASVVAEKNGVLVAHVERLAERTVVVVEDGAEKARSVSDLLQLTRSQAHGIARGMRIVGRWKSAEGDIQYVAMAAVCDRKGNPRPGEDPR